MGSTPHCGGAGVMRSPGHRRLYPACHPVPLEAPRSTPRPPNCPLRADPRPGTTEPTNTRTRATSPRRRRSRDSLPCEGFARTPGGSSRRVYRHTVRSHSESVNDGVELILQRPSGRYVEVQQDLVQGLVQRRRDDHRFKERATHREESRSHRSGIHAPQFSKGSLERGSYPSDAVVREGLGDLSTPSGCPDAPLPRSCDADTPRPFVSRTPGARRPGRSVARPWWSDRGSD